jgi:hypothetical protein
MLFFLITMNERGWNSFPFPNLHFDLPAQVVNVIVFAECLARAEDGWRIKPGQASLILCLAALAFAIKPVAGVSVLFAVGVALYGLKKSRSFSVIHLCVAFLPAATAGLIWMARNILLSGYPLFPLPLFQLPLDWTVPKEMVIGTYEDIIAWARSPGPGYRESLHNWNWVIPWLERYVVSRRDFQFSAGLPFLAAIPLWIAGLCRRRNVTPTVFGVWILLCLGYWFFSAPAIRFGAVFFQIFLALGLAFALHQVPKFAALEAHCVNYLQNRRLCIAGSTIALLIAISVSAGLLNSSKRSVVHVGVIPPREFRSRPFDMSVSPPVLLFFPANGDQCGNSPLPCTPYDNSPNLRLRSPGNLGGGFIIE